MTNLEVCCFDSPLSRYKTKLKKLKQGKDKIHRNLKSIACFFFGLWELDGSTNRYNDYEERQMCTKVGLFSAYRMWLP
jgi:hypothetical protein